MQAVENKKSNRVEFVNGMTLCPYCLSDDVVETELYVKCNCCGMGRNKSGRR